MKFEKLLSALTGTALGMILAVGSLGCLLSAFDLTLQNPAALWGTVFLVTAVCGLFLQGKYGSIVCACLLATGAGYLLRYGTAAEEAKRLLQHLSAVYDRAYHWGALEFAGISSQGSIDLPLGIWAACISMAAVRTVSLSRTSTLPVVLALIPLAACTVVTDTVPGETPLFLLLAGLILLILPACVRRENRFQSLRLTALALLPVVFGLGLLFRAVPQKSYVNRTAVIQENIRTAVEHLPQLMEEGLADAAASFQGTPAQKIDLSRLGQRIPFTYPVMEVTAQRGGTLYLRDQDYDRYDGKGWTASEHREEAFFREGAAQTLTIRTRGIRQVQYLPYYPAQPTTLTGGRRENSGGKREFVLSATILPEDWRSTVYQSAGEPEAGETEAFLTLPETTRQAALAFLGHALRPGSSNTEKADIIAALVTDCADYSLSPEKMPENATDFALWFLEEADTGYCIHFATAAAVLLRAADIPARYVTGYMAEAVAGETITITEEDAHAWAEYYEPRLGCWIPLEATPAEEAGSLIPATTPEIPATLPATAATEPEAPETQTTVPPPVIPTAPQIPTEAEAPSNRGLWLLLVLPALALVLAALRSVRLHLRRKGQRTGSTNAQALQRFREAERLARLLKETPAEELIVLAQKAKYSQHAITPEELQQFDSYCRSCLRRLKEKAFWHKLIYQYFYAIY